MEEYYIYSKKKFQFSQEPLDLFLMSFLKDLCLERYRKAFRAFRVCHPVKIYVFTSRFCSETFSSI